MSDRPSPCERKSQAKLPPYDRSVLLPRASRKQFSELDHLYQTAPVGLALLDRDLRFIRINDHLAAINGRPAREHVGRRLHEVVPEVAAQVEAVFRKVIETGEPVLNDQIQSPVPPRPGVPRVWTASYHPFRSDDGRVVGVSVVVEDITERKRMEEALRRSEARYRGVVDTQTELICRFLPDCRLTFVNEAYCRYFGRTRDELLGVDFLTFLPEEARGGARRHVASLTQATPTVTYSHPVIASDSEIRWQEWTDRAICDVDGRVVEYQSVGRDITGQKRAEQALEERARFEALLTDLSADFIHVPASHVDETIERSLKRLTAFLNIDRSSLAEFSDDGRYLQVTHSYALLHVPKMPTTRLDASLAWYARTLQRGQPVVLQRLPDDLPQEAADGAGGPFQGLRSHLAVPLTIDGSTIGKLSFSTFRAERPWPDMLVQRLRVVGEVFANALARKRSQEALQRAEELNRAVLESLQSLIAVLDRDGTIIAVNDAWASFGHDCGIDASDGARVGVGANYIEVYRRAAAVDRADAEVILAGIRSVIDGSSEAFRQEYLCPAPSGPRWFSMSVTPYRGRGGGAVVTHTDITELKLTQRSLKTLSGRLLKAQEEERSRIARELHDDFNQRFVLLTVELEQLGQALPRSQARLAGKIETLRRWTADLSSDLHKLSHSLHSTLLEHLGIAAAARSHCDAVSKQHSIRIDFSDVGMPGSLPKDVALCLFRALQEALQNAVKHSGAQDIQVRLVGNPAAIHLRILDNGLGFDPVAVHRKQGLGLVSMRERTEFVGGTCSIRARPGEGVGIDIRIPLRGTSAG